MAKLFPPTVKGKLPAIRSVDENNRHFRFYIPFLHNTAIDSNLYTGMIVYIKTASTNLWIDTFTIDKRNIKDSYIDLEVESNKFKVGQFYKIQLAYIDNDDDVGMYSTVGVSKCVKDGTATAFINNVLGLEVAGEYQVNSLDYTEVEYSYSFDLYKFNSGKYELLKSSGELLHNSQSNELGLDTYSFGEILPAGDYKINYNVTTINESYNADGLLFKIGEKQLNQNIASPQIEKPININNGNVKIFLRPVALGESWPYSKLYLMRYNGAKWELLTPIENYFTYIDNTVEQGLIYDYTLCRITESLDAGTGRTIYNINESMPATIEVDYESIQLSDGDKQLSITFNPKINSFKNTIQEQKLDTLGGKYPFIFRNGRMNYKEIGISGLISYHMDENNLFLQNSDIGLSNENQRVRTNAIETNLKNRTTQLTGYNVAAERQFREAVVSWLTNGQPKLLRSPTEGIFIVRLINVSLTPNEQLGRLLYTFSATAYEIAENNLENLNKYNLIWGEHTNV